MQTEISIFLNKIAEAIDIEVELYEEAICKYEEVGVWLSEDDSELKEFSPEIYPQGSFRLGTVVQPLSQNEEYDIDLVCKLKIEKEKISQNDLKNKVGARLKQNPKFADIIDPSRRCWVLTYPKQFHIDVLPTIPNSEGSPTSLLLTDKDLVRWQHSDPIAYADWFYSAMKKVFEECKEALAKSMRIDVADVPSWLVKTPLQKTIQLLKRHRDVHFKDDCSKPASIIITTLATLAYRGEANLFDALVSISQKMLGHIENRNGKWWIENPVNKNENFADKWNEDLKKKDSFEKWVKQVQQDFLNVSKQNTLQKVYEVLFPLFGTHTVSSIAKSMGITPSSVLVTSNRSFLVPGISDTSHVHKPIWPENLVHKAKIKASVYPKKNFPKKLWDLSNRSVPKNVWLRFEVQTDVKRPYTVKWQVVNTGQEALNANQLRGDFYEGSQNDSTINWESTSYKGTHWVEAFIIKDNSCVARSGRKLVLVRDTPI